MKISNPFSVFLRKMREEHNASIELNNKKTVNTDVTIANDPNDPETGYTSLWAAFPLLR